MNPPSCERWKSDAGSTLLLTIFYAALALALILVVVAVTSLYLERKRLFTLADGASLVGAEAFDVDSVQIEGQTPGPTLRSDDVADAVNDYLHTAPTQGFQSFQVVSATSADGRSATVELAAEWKPPLVTLFVPDGIRIEVTSVARSVFSG
jgi:uncharacterized membrane protein